MCVQTGPFQQVDPSLGVLELVGYVKAIVDVDDAGLGALRSEHGEPSTGVGLQFQVDTWSAARQRADYLSGQGVTLELTEAGQDGESRVEVDGHCVVARVDDHSFEAHNIASALRGPRLERSTQEPGRCHDRVSMLSQPAGSK
jgi:hypothetical protein